MKKNKKENGQTPRDFVRPEKYHDKDEVWIRPALLEKDFITTIEKWWKDTFEPLDDEPLDESSYLHYLPSDGVVGIDYLKEFIKKKKPELLGVALLWNPYLLEHPDIRAQLINWLNVAKFTMVTGDKRLRASIESFANALKPRAVKGPTKEGVLASIDEVSGELKEYYDFLYETITKEFENYKKKENKRKLNEKDKSTILKKTFQSIKNEYEDLNGMKFSRYFNELAKLSKPSQIAMKVFQDQLKRDADFEIGISKIKKFISDTKS